MDKLYAPWRSNYITGNSEASQECVFCEQAKSQNDESLFILARFKYVYVVMNLYPYNSGHLLIVPYAHKASLAELADAEQNELMHVAAFCEHVLMTTINPHGFNVGLNLGRAAGAGIPGHMHMHVVPRWEGDTNFMPVIGETKTVSFDLNKMFETLKPAFLKN